MSVASMLRLLVDVKLFPSVAVGKEGAQIGPGAGLPEDSAEKKITGSAVSATVS